MRFTTILGTLAAATALWSTPTLAADEIACVQNPFNVIDRRLRHGAIGLHAGL